MRVGELTRQTGASIRSLRYYKQEGLLPAHRVAPMAIENLSLQHVNKFSAFALNSPLA